MTPLPRLLAYLDDAMAAREDLGIRLAAVAALGPTVALVARYPGGTTDALTALASRCVANARPPRAEVWVTGRVDVALAVGASAVIRRRGDLDLGAMHEAAGRSAPGDSLRHIASVHSLAEARTQVEAGAEALVVGTIWPSATHPGEPTGGLELLEQCAATGVPCYAIGGVTPARATLARDHGAWGVAAIRAIWDAPDSHQAARALLPRE